MITDGHATSRLLVMLAPTLAVSMDVNLTQVELSGQFERSPLALSPGPSCHFPICTSLHAHMSKCLYHPYDSNVLPSGHRKSLLFIRWRNEPICPMVPPSSIPSPHTSVPVKLQRAARPLGDRRHWERLDFYVCAHLSLPPWWS